MPKLFKSAHISHRHDTDLSIVTMSDLPVPGAHPWVAPIIINQCDTVNITVGTDYNLRDFVLHVDALRQQSTFFRHALPPLTNAYMKRPRIPLTLSTPLSFGVFATWLYHGSLGTLNESKLSYLFLAQLYAFANGFSIPLLRNKIVDVFFENMRRDAPEIPYDVMAYLDDNLRDSALRDMVLDMVFQCGDKNKVVKWKVNLAKGTWLKGYSGDEVGDAVPFGRTPDVTGYLEEMRGKVHEK